MSGFLIPPLMPPRCVLGYLAVFNGAVYAYREYMKYKFKEWQQRDKPIKVEFVTTPEWLV